MRVPREAWWLAGLIVFMCLIALLVGRGERRPGEGEGGLLRRTTYSSTPHGLRALYLTLEELDYDARRLRAPFAAATLPPRGALVVVEPRVPITPREWKALRRWVAAGHTLILASEWQVALAKSSIPVTEIAFEEPPQTHARPCQPTYLAQGVKRLAIRAEFRLLLPQLPTAKDEHQEAEDDEDEGSLSAAWYPGSLREDLSRAVPVFRDAKGTVVAYARMGEGRVILLSSPWTLSNDGIGKHDNVIFALNALGPPEAGPVHFDEYHQGYGENLLRTMIPLPLKVALGHLVLGLLVAIYACSRRFGPIIPLDRGIRRRSEFLGTMTALLRKGRATRLAVRTAHDAAVRHLRRQLGLPSNAGVIELGQAAARVSPEAGEKLTAALRQCRNAWEMPGTLTEGRAAALVRQLDQAVRQVRQI